MMSAAISNSEVLTTEGTDNTEKNQTEEQVGGVSNSRTSIQSTIGSYRMVQRIGLSIAR